MGNSRLRPSHVAWLVQCVEPEQIWCLGVGCPVRGRGPSVFRDGAEEGGWSRSCNRRSRAHRQSVGCGNRKWSSEPFGKQASNAGRSCELTHVSECSAPGATSGAGRGSAALLPRESRIRGGGSCWRPAAPCHCEAEQSEAASERVCEKDRRGNATSCHQRVAAKCGSLGVVDGAAAERQSLDKTYFLQPLLPAAIAMHRQTPSRHGTKFVSEKQLSG